MDKLIRVVFYIRVSTEEQKLHGLSLKAQYEKLKEYCEKHGYKLVAVYQDEGVSGRKPIKTRPQLQKMLNEAKNGTFDLILFIKLDRYFRSVAEYHDCQRILDEHDIKWTATEEKYDLTTANGRAFVNMKLTIAELEADTTSERIILVNDYKVKQGLAVTGRPCYGWKIIEKEGRKINVIDENKEAEVRDLLDLIEFHHSFTKAVRIIQEKYNVNTYQKTYRKLASNTWLYGKYRDNDNYCEPYITKERFDRIQEIINKNTRERVHSHDYLFSTLVTCDYCGSNMSGNYCIKSNGKVYYAYRCNYRMKPNVKCFKASHSIGERTIEKYLINNIHNIVNEYIVNAEASKTKSKPKPKKSKRDSILKEMERLNNMYQKGRIEEDKYDEEYDRLKDLLAKEPENDIVIDHGANIEALNKLLHTDIKEIYYTLDREHRKSFWQNLIKEIFIDNRKNPKVRKVILNDKFIK